MVKVPGNLKECALPKGRPMESFEELETQYRPMIHHLLRVLKIYKNQDEFRQVALIALWEARQGFDPEKGAFSSYAYSFMKGKMMTELHREVKREERCSSTEDVYLEAVPDERADQPLETATLMAYCKGMTDKQRQWVLLTFRDGLTVREIAEREGVSPSAVKKWKAGAIARIKTSRTGG